MKTKLFTSVFLFIGFYTFSQTFNYQRSWGTYFGDERYVFKDSKTDQNGNLYIVGYVFGEIGIPPNFTTPNSPQPVYGGGIADGFIVKFNNLGQLVWGTFLGGTDADRIEGIDIDQNNNVYIIGDTNSANSIATSNSYQPIYGGLGDMMLTKYSQTGNVIWSTYFGTAQEETYDIYQLFDIKKFHIVHDQLDNFYIAGNSFGDGLGTSGVFQPNRNGSAQSISKFNNDGNKVWTTYYANNGSTISAIDVSASGLYVSGKVNNCGYINSNYYGTSNGFQPSTNGCLDIFFTKFNLSGQRIWSSYYGGAFSATSKSMMCYQDKVYITGISDSNPGITTPGSQQEFTSNSGYTPFIVKFNDNCNRFWGTFNGSNALTNGASNPNASVFANKSGDLFTSGSTNLGDNIATIGAYKSTVTGGHDGYICKYNENGTKIWGTYYGGEKVEYETYVHPYNNNFFVVGRTTSTQQMTTPGSYQENFTLFDNGFSNQIRTNIFIAHFEPNALNNNTFDPNNLSLFPNPTKGKFTIKGNFNTLYENVSLDIYDQIGRKIISQNVTTTQNEINHTFDFQNKLSKGVYFAKLISNETAIQTFEVIIE